jgi:hypothetical protein
MKKSCLGQLTRDPHDKDPFKKKQQLTVSGSLFKEKDVEKKLQKAHSEARALEEAIETFIDNQASKALFNEKLRRAQVVAKALESFIDQKARK